MIAKCKPPDEEENKLPSYVDKCMKRIEDAIGSRECEVIKIGGYGLYKEFAKIKISNLKNRLGFKDEESIEEYMKRTKSNEATLRSLMSLCFTELSLYGVGSRVFFKDNKSIKGREDIQELYFYDLGTFGRYTYVQYDKNQYSGITGMKFPPLEYFSLRTIPLVWKIGRFTKQILKAIDKGGLEAVATVPFPLFLKKGQ